MDIVDPGVQGEAEKETESNLDTNTSLVMAEQEETRDMEYSRNGNRILEDKESYPRQTQMDPNTAGQIPEDRGTPRLAPAVRKAALINLGSHRPSTIFPNSARQLQNPIGNVGHPWPERYSNETGPISMDLANPPNTHFITNVG